jgi:FKBP-type peptidyl-prolyl cis-trans isomerase
MVDIPQQKPTTKAMHCISGLIYEVLKPGKGDERPGPHDVVHVRYKEWNADGQLIDASNEQGPPRSLSVGEVMPGLSEAFQLMTVGQQMRVWIPAALTSEKSAGQEMLFDLELVGFTRIGNPPSISPELVSPRKPQ